MKLPASLLFYLNWVQKYSERNVLGNSLFSKMYEYIFMTYATPNIFTAQHVKKGQGRNEGKTLNYYPVLSKLGKKLF